MTTEEWFGLAAICLSIMIPSIIGIHRLVRIEANTEFNGGRLTKHDEEFADVKKQITGAKTELASKIEEHNADCNTDRAQTRERLDQHDRRLERHSDKIEDILRG